MKLWIATSNSGKLNEFKSLLMPYHVEIHAPNEISSYYYPEETGETLEANARIKAKSLKTRCSNDWVLAEDSGLEVEGLNNMPGVYSARYAGDHSSDAENMAKVLKMLSIRSPMNRNAKFKCVMILISPTGEEFLATGEVLGQISKKIQGDKGFGYDPIFLPEGETQSFAELGSQLKNKVSHRKRALEQILEILKREAL